MPIDDIIHYWLGGPAPDLETATRKSRLWYRGGAGIDREIATRFGALLRAAEQDALRDWEERADGSLALAILLDQFTRNLYRRSARAFSNDARALTIARGAIARGFDARLSPVGRIFLYHPFHHAESPADQDEAVRLFDTLRDGADENWLTFFEPFSKSARSHRDVVRRFGRFPHRNQVLGRPSTAAELSYLATARRHGQ